MPFSKLLAGPGRRSPARTVIVGSAVVVAMTLAALPPIPASAAGVTYAAPAGIITFAGGGPQGYSGDGGPAVGASFGSPTGVGVDSNNNLYITDSGNCAVRKVTAATGIISTMAGGGPNTCGYGGDGGPAASAKLSNGLSGLAVDGAGDVFFADSNNQVVRKVTANGTISTVAGIPAALAPGPATGPATGVGLVPNDVAVNSAGTTVYASDWGNCVIWKVTGGTASVVAGSLTNCGYSPDGTAGTAAQLDFPSGLALDAQGNLYFSEDGNCDVRKLSPSGQISTVTQMGGGAQKGLSQCQAGSDPFNGLALDGSGNLAVGDPQDCRIGLAPHVTQPATTLPIASPGLFGNSGTLGGPGCGPSGDGGPFSAAQLGNVAGLTFDGAGHLFIADAQNGVVRQVSPP